MSYVKALIVLLSSTLVACATVDQTASRERGGLSEQRLNALTIFMQSRIDAGHLPGTVMVVSHKGKMVYSKALGWLNPKARTPMTEDALFRMYSMTKPVVSVATLILLEEGKLQINDPVSMYLPEMKNMKVWVEKVGADGKPTHELVAASRQLTLLDLMRHTAGMTYGDTKTQHDAEYLKAFPKPTGSNEFIKNVADLPLAHQPGSQWSYGISHDVLGVVVERVSGKPLQVFLEERIFRPLKMTDTTFWVEPANHHRIAEPFEVDPDSKRPIDLSEPRRMSPMAAGGGSSRVGNGLMSTARDYLRFVQMVANGGQLDGVRILSRKSVELIGTDHIKGLKAPTPGHGWGLGVSVRNELGGANQHGSVGDYWWGGAGGTSFIIDPSEHLVAVRMSQAPASRGYYNRAFRNFVYSALE